MWKVIFVRRCIQKLELSKQSAFLQGNQTQIHLAMILVLQKSLHQVANEIVRAMFHTPSLIVLFLPLRISIEISWAYSSSAQCSWTSITIHGCSETSTQCCNNGVCKPRNRITIGFSTPQSLTLRQSTSCPEFCKHNLDNRCFKKCNVCTDKCGSSTK